MRLPLFLAALASNVAALVVGHEANLAPGRHPSEFHTPAQASLRHPQHSVSPEGSVLAPGERSELQNQRRAVLLQRSAATRHSYFHKREQETLWGLPKVVWVIIADVIAMLAFFALIPLVLSCAKKKGKASLRLGSGS